MTDRDDTFEQRVADTLRAKVAQLPSITMTLDRNAAPLTPIEPPTRPRSRILVVATVAAVVVLVAVALAIATRSGDSSERHPAGPSDGPVVARIELDSLPTLSFQVKELTTVAGINEITLVGQGGTEALVFDDPALARFRLEYPSGPSVGTVNLQAGKDYRIHSVIPGHAQAGMTAVIHVLPVGAPGTPPLPKAVLDEVSQASRSAGGALHGEAEYTAAGRNTANQTLNAGETPRDEQPVYVFVLHGSFVDQHSHGPLGSPAPRGSVMTLTISQEGPPGVLDFGLSSGDPNLSRLGGAITTKF